jgi:hypothetical protein
MRARPVGTLPLEADVYEIVERCWREQWEDAFVRASRMLATGRYKELWCTRALKAARFESGRRLGRFVPDLERSILAAFDAHPFTRAWAERLRRASASRALAAI